MMDFNTFARPAAAAAAMALSMSALGTTPVFDWGLQFGTAQNETGEALAVDSTGHVYITGGTRGALGGPNAGDLDAYLAKYDPSGNLIWNKQLGAISTDLSLSLAIDSADNAYISGLTSSSLGGASSGNQDAFLAKYDSAGNLDWTRQLGTSATDFSRSVAVDSAGNAYITGITQGSLGGAHAGSNDAFLAKYNTAGTLVWTRQLGTSSNEDSTGVAVDGSGNVYISGFTLGSLGGPNAGSYDAFLAKYDAAGNLDWTRQIGSGSSDRNLAVTLDNAGNIFITGNTTGSLDGVNAGNTDVFVTKFDSAGNETWTRQLGTADYESGNSIAADAAGDVYISGFTTGSLGGPSSGGNDVILVKYDADGNLIWTEQIGSDVLDISGSVVLDGTGNAYLTGRTYGSMVGPNSGGEDAFLIKYSNVPEPGSLVLLAIAGPVLLRRRRAAPRAERS